MNRTRSNPERPSPRTGIRRAVRGPRARSGLVLIVVLVVIAILALSAYTYSMLMQAESEAVRLAGERLQSKYLVDSGVDSVRVFLSQPDIDLVEAGGTYDNPAEFQGVLVKLNEDPNRIGRFSVIAASIDSEGNPAGFRYGLSDESTRLNLNVLLLADQLITNGGRNLLMALPGMTETAADSIMDWIDEDDDRREYGAELEFYAQLSPPYAPKNGPLESITELLLVNGVTAEMLFGADTNQNGVLDQAEMENDPTGGNLELALGWTSYMTLYSKERNLTSEGLPKIYLNSNDLEQLYRDLRSIYDDSWSRYIIYLRQYGPYSGEDEAVAMPGSVFLEDPDFSISPVHTFSQVLDLVDQQVDVPGIGEDGEALVIESPIGSGGLILQLPLLMDNLTTVEGLSIPGRININQAPRRVLEGIPGMEPEIVDEIINRREAELDDTDPNRLYETWILAEGIVDLQLMRTLLPFVCVQGAVYRAEVTGYFQDGMASSRAEVIVDSTEIFPRVLFWRDKSHLQVGYEIETLGLGTEALR